MSTPACPLQITGVAVASDLEPTAPVPAIPTPTIEPAVWKYVGKLAEDSFERNQMAAGAKHFVELRVDARVDGKPFRHESKGTVVVGKDFEKATSVGATAVQVLAYLLAKVNAAQRNATLAELAEVYERNQCQLPVSEDDLALAELCMEKLRRKHTTTQKGAVKVSYVEDKP